MQKERENELAIQQADFQIADLQALKRSREEKERVDVAKYQNEIKQLDYDIARRKVKELIAKPSKDPTALQTVRTSMFRRWSVWASEHGRSCRRRRANKRKQRLPTKLSMRFGLLLSQRSEQFVGS